MSVHRSDKVLDVKTEYLFEWLTRDKADTATPEEAAAEEQEKKFESLIDELHKDRKKKFHLYKPRTGR